MALHHRYRVDQRRDARAVEELNEFLGRVFADTADRVTEIDENPICLCGKHYEGMTCPEGLDR